jgi:integrase
MNWAREKNRTTNLADTKVHQIREGKKKESKFPVPLEEWQAVGEKLIRKWSLAQVVLVGSGMRYGELAAMRSEHLQKSKGNGAIEIPEAKGRVGRIVPVSKVVFEAAQELLEIRAKGEAKSEDEEKDDRESPFIPDDEGVQMGDRIESACARAGVRRYTAHQLRHTYATGCLMNGMNLLEFQRRMGHADLKTTEAYLHIVQAIKGDPKDYAPV